ncbi:MAG: hypothetical protein ABFR95_11260, partial [Actinomycetota bacterium]
PIAAEGYCGMEPTGVACPIGLGVGVDGLEPSTPAENAQGTHLGIPSEQGRLAEESGDTRHEVETE